MMLSAVYRCVTCISDAVAQLPLEIYNVDANGYKEKAVGHPLYRLLNSKPNARMTRYVFISAMVQGMLLNGSGYAYILRDDKGTPEQLVFIPSEKVTVLVPQFLDLPPKYRVEGIRGDVPADDMIHLVNQTFDGVTGVSTLNFAFNTLELAHDAEYHARTYFANGCSISGVLKSNQALDDEDVEKIKEGWNRAHSGENTNSVAVLGYDLDFRAVASSATDAQLLETREFNVVDIARFFGVSPVKVGDLSKSSYSTVEATQLAFLTDTISPLLEKIELELETKLFPDDPHIDVRFDVSQLLRADKSSLAQYYNTLFQIGAITPNEIRRATDLPKVEGGDNNFVQVNLQTLEKAAQAPAEPQPEKDI